MNSIVRLEMVKKPDTPEKFKPRPQELAEIRRRLFIARCAFANWVLQGMLNTNRHILSLVLPAEDIEWFEQCIRYMKDRVRIEKEEAKK